MLFAFVGGRWLGMARMGEFKYVLMQAFCYRASWSAFNCSLWGSHLLYFRVLGHIFSFRLLCLFHKVISGSTHCGGQAGFRFSSASGGCLLDSGLVPSTSVHLSPTAARGVYSVSRVQQGPGIISYSASISHLRLGRVLSFLLVVVRICHSCVFGPIWRGAFLEAGSHPLCAWSSGVQVFRGCQRDVPHSVVASTVMPSWVLCVLPVGCFSKAVCGCNILILVLHGCVVWSLRMPGDQFFLYGPHRVTFISAELRSVAGHLSTHPYFS